jgi:biopolymer transport protein ExbB
MNKTILIPVFVLSVVASWFIWINSPEYIKQGGPLLVIGLTCLFLVVIFTFERFLVLWRAGGRSSGAAFVRKLKASLQAGRLEEAVENCKHQGGCLANVIGAGLTRYHAIAGEDEDQKALISETRRALREANALESPLLERNLTVLSTLASIATLVGLLGTTIGMIRAFRAMSHAGAPDATQLALGISEALVNTALGLTTAIIGTVLYNYFTARVDGFNTQTEETAYEVLQLLENRKGA